MSRYAKPSLTWAQVGQFFHGFFPGQPTYTEKDYPSLDGKVVVITGASTGVGYQTVKSLAASTNAKVYIFARNEQKTLDAIKKIELEVAEEYGKSPINTIEFVEVDLSDLTTIKPAVEKFLSIEKRLDIIIHNAGVMQPPWGSTTAQGHDLQLGTNGIGHHLLQKLLDPIFIKTAKLNKPNESRVVWVSSTAHLLSPLGGLDLDDPNLTSSGKNQNPLAYAQSKAVNAVQARYWAKVHSDDVEKYGIVSISLCPGYLASELGRSFSAVAQWFVAVALLHNVRKGAYTELFAALSPDISTAHNGRHIVSFGQLGLLREDLNEDSKNKKVWDYLESQVAEFA